MVGRGFVGLMLVAGLLAVPHGAVQENAVISGNARFEVLSPTLIRTEYAPDGKFTDAATFNVVGRDKFPPPAFRSSSTNGWLTIDTGAVTLRYRVGSGAFAADNLTVRLNAGRQVVQAAPWAGHVT